jgi:hypothetical protein
MPIIIRDSPARIAELICIYIIELAQARQVPPWDPVEVRVEDLSQSDPHPVFVAPLAALVKGRLLEAAQQTGWRVLLVQGEQPVAEAELSGKSQRGAKGGSALKVISLTRGPFTEATIEALSVAEKLPRVAKAKYELRFLKAPAVYFAALWLHGEKQDVLIPMVDPPGGLKKNRAYSEEQVIKALRGIAQQNQSFHDNFREPGPKRRRKGKRSA